MLGCIACTVCTLWITPMTVKEVISHLQSLPDQDAQVAIQSGKGTEPEGLFDIEGYPKDHNFPFVFFIGDSL